jgi:hypothetical protein
MDVYQAITSKTPVWIDGADFMALNYGEEYGHMYQNDHRKVIFSGKTASYYCLTPESEFPQNAKFEKWPAHTPIREATHVHDELRERTSLKLEEVVLLLRARGMSI